jgi:hypothetical protein
VKKDADLSVAISSDVVRIMDLSSANQNVEASSPHFVHGDQQTQAQPTA